ncbi:hypothetical protein NQ315_001006 [Exocentrus adspersus]|uniref:folate gamma-glutamyl hydrolase n=1 Tax=Exocentrus adspersus TaxID=1586481 RepID=A0AAV8WGH8_9CUCU|nr:hypothetical protein NQ315_001006 [Exocentrus adspersus]
MFVLSSMKRGTKITDNYLKTYTIQSGFQNVSKMFNKASALVLLTLVVVTCSLETPIIGILSQETFIVSHLFPEERHDSFIAASYVKHIESGGGRVVPIWIGQSEDYYRRVVSYTNGVLFPGGGTYFNVTGGYGQAAKQIYKFALEANTKGIYYPVWGSCLGMEVLAFASLDGKDIRVDCLLKNVAVPLNFTKAARKSKLFSKAPKSVLTALASQDVAFNFHRYCLTKSVLEENSILSNWKVLATNKDVNQLEFISAMESKEFPIYGVQFHPEKNQFEFEKNKIPHSKEAVEVAQYFGNFFVDEARRNNNTFPSIATEKKSLIYNYNPRYTGLKGNSVYEQLYVFDKTDFEAAQLL